MSLKICVYGINRYLMVMIKVLFDINVLILLRSSSYIFPTSYLQSTVHQKESHPKNPKLNSSRPAQFHLEKSLEKQFSILAIPVKDKSHTLMLEIFRLAIISSELD